MPRTANERQPLSGASPAAAPLPAWLSPRYGDGQAACADARHGRRPSPSSSGPTVAAVPPQARIAASRPYPSRGGALVTRQRPPQKGVSLACVPAGPVPSARSRFGRRGRRRHCRPVAPPTSIASTTLLIRRRQRLSLRRRRRAAGVVDDHSASGMPCVANERQPLSGASPAAAPLPVLSSPRHGDGQAACADARHGRRPSPSSTGPTVAALPPQVGIAASRSYPSRGGALVTRQRPPQKGVS